MYQKKHTKILYNDLSVDRLTAQEFISREIMGFAHPPARPVCPWLRKGTTLGNSLDSNGIMVIKNLKNTRHQMSPALVNKIIFKRVFMKTVLQGICSTD